MKPAAVLAMVLLAACSSTSTASRPSPTPSPAASASASASTALPTPSPTPSPSPSDVSSPSVSPSPSAPPITVPAVSCKTGSDPIAMAMIGGYAGAARLIYDVSDPVHPRLVCTITGTAAHLVTGDTFAYLKPVSQNETDVMLHSIASGNDSKTASFPVNLTDPNLNEVVDEAWRPDGSLLAYTVADENTETVQVWLVSGGQARAVHQYGLGTGDCACRFGIAQAVLAFSPDGAYLLDGWVAGKGATPLTVIRVSDGAVVYTADISVSNAVWSPTGHQLFLIGNGMQSWTPETGALVMQGSPWSVLPSFSPDGSTVAFTTYADPDTQLQPRVYDYDLKAQQTHLLVDKLRTQALFVKDGWVWYLEEHACSPGQCAGTTAPTGNVYAMQLSTGAEQPVTFAAGEAPLPDGDWRTFAPGEFWPAA